MTTPNQVNKLADKCRSELEAYIDIRAESDEPLDFASFIRDKSAFVIENSVPGTNYKEFWSCLFGQVVKAKGVRVKSGNVNWRTVDSAVHGGGPSATQSPHSPSNPTTTSSAKSSSSPHLTALQKTFFEATYANLPCPTWKLHTGKEVESTMLSFCRACTNEHPAHSLLLDLKDKVWHNFFTKEEIHAMEAHNLPSLPSLPTDLKEYLERYKGKHNLEELTDINMMQCFHPKKNADLHWAQRAIGDALDLYHYNYDINGKTEADLVRRLWGFIEKCFDESQFYIVSGEKASSSSSERKNENRSITGIEDLTRKSIGHKVDVLIKHLENEYGCAEAGLSGGLKSTKYIKESTLKVPKILRDMLWKISQVSPGCVDKLCLAGFVINGTALEIKIIDVPEGNVCRITTLGPLVFPLEATQMYKFLTPLLTIVWQVKALLKNTLLAVQNDDSIFVPTMSAPVPQPHVTACIPSPPPRKRKLSDANE